MKLVIAGSRHIELEPTDLKWFLFLHRVPYMSTDFEIVSGGCPTGADRAAKLWSLYEGHSYKEFPANWDKYGSAAGPMRNGEMAAYGDVLLLIWDGESRGSASMKARMSAMKKPIYEIIIKKSI